MSIRWVLVVVVSAVAAACDSPPPPQPYQSVTDVPEVMVWVLDPAADVVWDSAGAIITEAGTEELAPTTDEGWDHARNNAATIAEVGNLLMLPHLAKDQRDWIEISQGLVHAGVAARDAATAHDADALFEAGANLYNVCVSCHQLYWVTQE